MRILRVADVSDNRTGGMTRAMYGTGDILAASGHQVDYAFSDQFRTGIPAALRRFTVPLEIPSLIRRLQRQGKQYDVLEIHEPLAAACCFLRPFLKALPPIVVFSHGLEERSRLTELAYWRQKGLTISLKKRYSPLSVVLQAAYATRHSSQVICLNTEDFQHLIGSGVMETHITLLHNGIEDDLIAAGESAAQESQERSGLLFIGTWLVRKGIMDLVPAVTEILRRHPEMRLTVAGSGASAGAVSGDFDLDVRSQITVIPKFSGNETLTDLFCRHSVFVLPSYFEGHPLVMIEAAAFGMAIITTGVCGMADFIQDGQNGLLVKVGGPADLQSKLESVVTDERLARRLGDAARLTAQSFTWERSAQTTLRAYERAIKNAAIGGSGSHES